MFPVERRGQPRSAAVSRATGFLSRQVPCPSLACHHLSIAAKIPTYFPGPRLNTPLTTMVPSPLDSYSAFRPSQRYRLHSALNWALDCALLLYYCALFVGRRQWHSACVPSVTPCGNRSATAIRWTNVHSWSLARVLFGQCSVRGSENLKR